MDNNETHNQVTNKEFGLTGTVEQPNFGFGLSEDNNSEEQLKKLNEAYQGWEYGNIREGSRNDQINGMLGSVRGKTEQVSADKVSNQLQEGNANETSINNAPPIGWSYNDALAGLKTKDEIESNRRLDEEVARTKSRINSEDIPVFSRFDAEKSNIYEKKIEPQVSSELKEKSRELLKKVLIIGTSAMLIIGAGRIASNIQKSDDALAEELARQNQKYIEQQQADADVEEYKLNHPTEDYETSYDDDGRLKVIKIESNAANYTEDATRGARN